MQKVRQRPYGTKLRIVRIIVVMLVEVDDVSLGAGGGGGATTPGESIIPADAETARTAVIIATAHVLRNLFTIL